MVNKFAKSKKTSPGSGGVDKCLLVFVLITMFVCIMHRDKALTFLARSRHQFFGSSRGKHIKAATWNIAAINNNPFEYWITNKDVSYNRIMTEVSAYIDNPGINDVPVKDIFTDEMFSELEESMRNAGWAGLVETRKKWETDYRERKVISQFIKDNLLGKKRLASMPDRVTNTINTVTEGLVMRPSVINCYNSGDLSTLDNWWKQWRQFMFDKEVTVKKRGVNMTGRISNMISKIKRSKYPSITEDEEIISIPLQILCAAIFDAILVNMMNTIDKEAWQPLREDMCNKLNRKKTERTIEILETAYGSSDILFLQEVASSFGDAVKNRQLSNFYDIYSPIAMDGDRDQNSFILLQKNKFRDVTEVTSDILQELDSTKKVPIANGDLLAVTAVDAEDGTKYLLASFHGDTNGLATIPIVTAMHRYAVLKRPDHKLLFGMDANTYDNPEEDQQGMVAFAEYYTSMKLNSCYGQTPNPKNFTTFHARTHLQPQLNKAVRLEEKDIKGDKNPKDFILFFSSDFHVVTTQKDNTGERKYIENMVFPTLSFPSDHGVTSTVLVEERTASTATDSGIPSKSSTDSSNPVAGVEGHERTKSTSLRGNP